MFCALAAFTNQFDVTAGIRTDKDKPLITTLSFSEGLNAADIQAESSREDRLVRLNAKGLSVTVALSRLLLLIEYLLSEHRLVFVSSLPPFLFLKYHLYSIVQLLEMA